MALTDEGSGMYMPVAPAYNMGGNGFGSGFGGDWGWIILLLLLAGGGWGNGMGGGFLGGGLGYDFPWILNGQNDINTNVSSGFRDSQIHDSITSVRDGISALSTQLCGCCGDIATQLCNGFSGVNAGVANGFAQAEIANNARQIADMQQMFGVQSALQNCCCENRAGLADLKYTVATENCADRAAISDGIRDVIANQTAGVQRILDQLCSDKIDAKNEKIADLERQLTMANLAASQTAQNAFIAQGLNQEVDALYNRLSNCPVPTVPVYGRQPIFTCSNNNCGCGCGM